MDKCPAKHHPTPPSAFTWRNLTPPKRVTRHGWPGNPPGWGTPPLMWKQSRKKRDCIQRLVTPTRRGTSPTWGPPPPCEQSLTLHFSTSIATATTHRSPQRTYLPASTNDYHHFHQTKQHLTKPPFHTKKLSTRWKRIPLHSTLRTDNDC